MKPLPELLAACAALHHHLCPRQVLGVRIGVQAGLALGLDLPQTGKRLLAIVETDGCAADGVAVATNCWVGRRSMRLQDYGKVAATFVDTYTGQAVRIAPRRGIRRIAASYAPEAASAWQAQLLGYQRMPGEALLSVQSVKLTAPLESLLGAPGVRTVCQACGEEIMNRREVLQGGAVLCRSCAAGAYYDLLPDPEARRPAPQGSDPPRKPSP